MSTSLESLIGKTVSFKVDRTAGTGTIASIIIRPSMSTKAALGFVADQASKNVVVPSQAEQGNVTDVNVVGGGRRRKTMKKRSSKH